MVRGLPHGARWDTVSGVGSQRHMDQAFEIATQFCKLAGASDLYAYLGLDPGCSADDARAALRQKRSHLQSMQANPKYKDVARAFIKGIAAFEKLVGEGNEYRAMLARAREVEQLPGLEAMIEGVLADGRLTQQEEEFLRANALTLGISLDRYESLLRERAEQRGIALPSATPAPGERRSIPPRRASGWWDASFTRTLLSLLPTGISRLVDVPCGGAPAVAALLPHRPQLRWTGIDDASRLATTRLGLAPYDDRCEVRTGRIDAIPARDAEFDGALSVFGLGSAPDPAAALAELTRVVGTGGRLIAVEPDRRAQMFWFDRPLPALNAAFHALAAEDRLALGPSLATRLTDAGVQVDYIVFHAVQGTNAGPMRQFGRRLRLHLHATVAAAGHGLDHPLAQAAEAEIARLEAEIGLDTHGWGCHLLPLFVVAGTR